MNEAQELHCHNCDRYVQFGLDLSIDDNYLLKCPRCGHDHYRVVKDGKITDERWGQDPSQMNYTQIYATGSTGTSTYTTYGNSGSSTASTFAYSSWGTTATC